MICLPSPTSIGLTDMAIMKRASITEAKNRLSALIDGLKSGSPVLIVDRGRPVARLEPVTRLGEGDQEGEGRDAARKSGRGRKASGVGQGPRFSSQFSS